MRVFVRISIIPRAGRASRIIGALADHLQIVTPAMVSRSCVFEPIAGIISEDALGELRHILAMVDFISVASVAPSPLDDACPFVTFADCGGKVYSPTATRHHGTMSGPGRSDANYLLSVTRGIGHRPVTLMVQHIRPHARTSLHHHERCREWFLTLLGRSYVYARSPRPRPRETVYDIGRVMPAVMTPHTSHQVLTGTHPTVNLLCMENFNMKNNNNIGLSDHYYETAGPRYDELLMSAGIG